MYLAQVTDCPPGSSIEVVVADRIIAIFNVDGNFHALDGVCPHQGGPLGKGELQDGIATCPWHGWQFHVENGKCLISPHIQQPKVQLRIQEGKIYLEESSD